MSVDVNNILAKQASARQKVHACSSAQQHHVYMFKDFPCSRIPWMLKGWLNFRIYGYWFGPHGCNKFGNSDQVEGSFKLHYFSMYVLTRALHMKGTLTTLDLQDTPPTPCVIVTEKPLNMTHLHVLTAASSISTLDTTSNYLRSWFKPRQPGINSVCIMIPAWPAHQPLQSLHLCRLPYKKPFLEDRHTGPATIL